MSIFDTAIEPDRGKLNSYVLFNKNNEESWLVSFSTAGSPFSDSQSGNTGSLYNTNQCFD